MSGLECEIERVAERVARRVVEIEGPRPLYLSAKNFKPLMGASWRWGKDIANSPDYRGEVIRVGKTILIETNAFLDRLRELSAQQPQPEHDAADAVLSEIIGPRGLRVV